MRLSKDKSSLTYNDFLTLDGIPPKTLNTVSATVPPSNG
jgi:hypothetical protein